MPKSPTPLRGALTGGRHQFLLGFASPEQARDGDPYLPPSPCLPEDRLHPRAQLRPAFACRRKMNTDELNSVEKGAHRRNALAPVRFVFAGADAGRGSCSPIRIRSTEDSVRIRAQFRLTFACRRKTNTEEPNSVEKGAHRRKAPTPVRVCFAGADASVEFVPPTSPCSPEDRV